MNILVQLPTRERPKRLMEAFNAMKSNQVGQVSYRFPVDNDDTTIPWYWLNQYGTAVPGPRVSKIEACNRGLPGDDHWDIVVLASDDMVCQVKGWDEIIRHDMSKHFPHTDGCLWYPDGKQENLCTLAVMGRKAFDQDGYIYRPEYLSLWADTEWTDVWNSRGKLWKSDQTLFSHLHPGWGTAKMDKLYRTNNALDRQDHDTYERRKALNFPA